MIVKRTHRVAWGIIKVPRTLSLERVYAESLGARSEAVISPLSDCSETGTLGEVF